MPHIRIQSSGSREKKRPFSDYQRLSELLQIVGRMVFVSFIDTGSVSDKTKAMILQCHEIYWVEAEGKGSGYL